MLTSTYTLVALSVEQTTVRAALQSLTRELHAMPDDDGILAPGQAARLCADLRQVVNDCHWRKLDKFLVPALRRVSSASDGLLRDLEQISRTASASLAAAEACVDAGVRGVDRDRFQEAVEHCIAALRRRLEREEHELFPMARSLVCGEAWFAIANQMLAHDAVARERRGAGRPERGPLAEPLAHAHESARACEREAADPDFGRRHAALSMLPDDAATIARTRQSGGARPSGFFAMMAILEVRFHHVRVPIQAAGRQQVRRQAGRTGGASGTRGFQRGRLHGVGLDGGRRGRGSAARAAG